MVWWQECLVQLSKGLSWSMPVWSVFLAAACLIWWLIKPDEDKKTRAKTLKEEIMHEQTDSVA